MTIPQQGISSNCWLHVVLQWFSRPRRFVVISWRSWVIYWNSKATFTTADTAGKSIQLGGELRMDGSLTDQNSEVAGASPRWMNVCASRFERCSIPMCHEGWRLLLQPNWACACVTMRIGKKDGSNMYLPHKFWDILGVQLPKPLALLPKCIVEKHNAWVCMFSGTGAMCAPCLEASLW